MIINKLNIGLDKRKVIGFISAFVLLLISYLLLIYNTQRMFDQSKLVEHTNKVIITLESTVSNIKEVGYSYRGFIITKEEKFASEFFRYLHMNDSLYHQLVELTKDNPLQQARLDTIRKAVDERMKEARAGMLLFRQRPELKDSLLQFGYVGKNTGRLTALVRKMQHYELDLLKGRADELDSFSKAIQAINFTSLAIACLLAIYSFITYLFENKERRKADQKAQQYRLELEQRVEELSKANKELTALRSIEKFASSGRIARTIAHEVRNPLTNIHLATEQLKDGVQLNDEQEMLLEMINRNGNRINQLIADLLNATKFSELHFKNLPLRDMMEGALDLAKDRIELNQVKVQKEYAGPGCIVKVDEDKIKIAFLNIIVNAIEAMKPGHAVLDISTKPENDTCKIIISDNGEGMNDETISRLFEPFFTNKQKGNGLGLTNTQNIILNHKGSIEVKSEPGKGTSFIITLQTISG